MKTAARVAVLLLFLLAGGCQSLPGTGGRVRVGSTTAPESRMAAELYAALLEKNGIAVERRFALGDGKKAMDALVAGRIDIYPETVQRAYLDLMQMNDGDTDPASVFDKVSKYYQRRYQIVWLAPSPLEDGNQIAPVIRSETLKANPRVQDALDRLAKALDEAALKELSRKVSSGKADAAAAAQDYLRQNGLIQ